MSTQRACDVCGFYRQDPRTGESRVHRYGLSRQFPRPELRPNGAHRYSRDASYGGLDMCDDCWERIAAPKKRLTRPDMRRKP